MTGADPGVADAAEAPANGFRGWLHRLAGGGRAALLPADPRQARPLSILVAIMCALACLAAFAAIGGVRAANVWTAQLNSAVTVIVRAPRDDGAVARAAALARGEAGVAAAIPVSKARARALIGAWGPELGDALDTLGAPRLVEARLADGAVGKEVAGRLQARLKAAGFDARVDDHGRFNAEILRAAGLARFVSLTAFAALVAAALAAVALAARAALETRRDAVEILHLVGAKDAFIAREVQTRFLRLGIVAGAAGALAAGLVLAGLLIAATLGAGALTRGAALLRWSDVLVLLGAPLASGLAAAISARLAAGAALRDLT